MHDIFTITIAFLAALNCSLIGVFLMLRRLVMVGDAISHAVLPGIVLSFMVVGKMNTGVILIGAIVAGCLAVLLISTLKGAIKINEGAAIGVTFTSFFAFGICLLSRYAHYVDLDQSCVLYGELSSAHFARLVGLGIDFGPRAIYLLLGLLLVNGTFIYLFYPLLIVSSFDASLATMSGLSIKKWHYAFLVLTAINIVAIFRIIGAPLVVGLLVGPATIAYLCTYRLSVLFAYTIVIDLVISLHGYLLAKTFDISLAGAMMVVVGSVVGLFLLVIQYKGLKQRLYGARVEKKSKG